MRNEKNTTEASGEYRKAFGQFSSIKTQRITVLDPVKVELDTQEKIQGQKHSIDFEGGDIKILKSGAYLIFAAPQVGKIEGNRNRWIDFWLRLNGKDMYNSNIRRVLTNKEEKDVISLNAVTDLNKGDVLNIMMAAETNDEGLRIEYMQPENQPAIPSMIVTMVQLD